MFCLVKEQDQFIQNEAKKQPKFKKKKERTAHLWKQTLPTDSDGVPNENESKKNEIRLSQTKNKRIYK